MNATDESLPLRTWTQSAGEEVANGISHGIGLVGGIIGTPILLVAAFYHGNIPFFIGTIIFTTTMLLVYLASTLYHSWPQTKTKSLLQVIDHAAIFLLIAGTYTPFALGPLLGGGGVAVLGFMRPLALAIPLSALLWLIAGGLAYTAGTLFFANERLRYGHFIWHLLALAGSSCHFVAVFICA